jgi:hypothetical protein
MFQQPILYSTKEMVENKSLVEKQNFSIASGGIPGGKPAKEEVWSSTFQRKPHPLAHRSFDHQSVEQLKRSSVPFGMNSPTNAGNGSPLTTTKGLFSTFRSGSSGMSPAHN